MAGRSRTPTARGALEPDGAFVVQLRSDCDVPRRLSGRVEHVVSGRSEQFGSLAALLAFMATHASVGAAAPAGGRHRNRKT
jgi:hypothetical protein